MRIVRCRYKLPVPLGRFVWWRPVSLGVIPVVVKMVVRSPRKTSTWSCPRTRCSSKGSGYTLCIGELTKLYPTPQTARPLRVGREDQEGCNGMISNSTLQLRNSCVRAWYALLNFSWSNVGSLSTLSICSTYVAYASCIAWHSTKIATWSGSRIKEVQAVTNCLEASFACRCMSAVS